MNLRQTLERQWQEGGHLASSLRPLGAVTAAVARWRRRHIRGREGVIPSIVVGNLSVGGSGKTPLVATLARLLGEKGWRVAIISRGYGAHPPRWPYRVHPDDPPDVAGDEPLLLAQLQNRTQAVYICPDRHQAMAAAAAAGFNLALLDDGFQHLALRATVQLLVLSGTQPLGNGYCLPAGPLREPRSALAAADALLVDDAAAAALVLPVSPPPAFPPHFGFQVRPQNLLALTEPQRTRNLKALAAAQWTAVTGIARPQRFVDTLTTLGARVDAHFFPDHHMFTRADLQPLSRPLVMTEKDAVKCRMFAGSDDWILRIEAELESEFMPWLERALALRRNYEH